VYNNVPAFAGKKKLPRYYEIVTGIIQTLRPMSSLSIIAQHLTAQGLLSPSDRQWDRHLVSSYIKAQKLPTLTTLTKE
jgi:hypothetical protein